MKHSDGKQAVQLLGTARRLFGVALLAAFGVASAGCTCGKRGENELAKSIEDGHPEQLESEIGIANPSGLLDELLKLAQNFVDPLPVQRDMLVSMALQRAHLPAALAPALELTRPLWLLELKGKAPAKELPSLVALPIRSRQALESALLLQMTPVAGKSPDSKSPGGGTLVTYTPKPEHPDLQAIKIWIAEQYAVIASDEGAFRAARAYLERRLFAQRPAHDVLLTFFRSKETRAKMREVLGQLRDPAARPGGSGPDTTGLREAISRLVLRHGEMITTAPRLDIQADIEGTTISLKGRAESEPSSELARAVTRQKTGPPVGAELIPHDTWGLFASHGLPAEQESSVMGGLLSQIAEMLPGGSGAPLKDALQSAGEALGDELTLALHPAKPGSMSAWVVTSVADTQKAKASWDRVGQLVAILARQEGKSKRGAPIAVRERELTCGRGAPARLLEVPVQAAAEAGGASNTPALSTLLGDTLGIGWVFRQKLAVLVLGGDVQGNLQKACATLDEQRKPASAFTASAAYQRAFGDADTHAGLLYLSVVDLVKSLDPAKLGALAPFAAAARAATSSQALSSAWGVDAKRSAYTFKLSLPLADLLQLKRASSPFGAPDRSQDR